MKKTYSSYQTYVLFSHPVAALDVIENWVKTLGENKIMCTSFPKPQNILRKDFKKETSLK